MATAEEFIKSSFRKIEIIDSETSLTSGELTDGIEVMNDTFAQLEIEGFELGYTPVSVGGDAVTLDSTGYNNFGKLQLAARLAQEYGVTFTEPLVADLKASRRAVIRELNRKALSDSSRGTFRYFVYAAIELLGVKSGSEPINAEEQRNGIERLNDLVINLESDGYGFGFNIGSSLDQDTNLPTWSYMWVKALLARNLSSSYSVEVSPVIIAMINEGEQKATNRVSSNIVTNFPETLPVGTTNTPDYSLGGNYFNNKLSQGIMDGSSDTLTDEQGNAILLDYPGNE